MTLHFFLLKLIHSAFFRNFIMTIILINTMTTAFYATFSKNPSKYETYLLVLEVVDSMFLGIYTIEFILKVSIRPRAFFYNGFNCFDFIVLMLSYSQMILMQFGSDNLGVFKVLRSIRALRPLRSVSFVGGLQVIVSALLTTLRTSFFHIMVLLSLIMFVFGIMGYYTFGYGESNQEDWGSFPKCILSLFVLVTAEGWPDVESNFNVDGAYSAFPWSRIYTISFLCLGHFVFSNLFVAVIIGQIDNATAQYATKILTKQETDLSKKKLKAHNRQNSEIKKMVESQQKNFSSETFKSRVMRSYIEQRSDEFILKKSCVSSSVWLHCFNQTYNRYAKNSATFIKLNREMVTCLAETLTKMKRVSDEEAAALILSDTEIFEGDHRRRHAVQHRTTKPSVFQQFVKECACNLEPT